MDEIAPLVAGGPTAICVSRFTAVKRLGLLVRAWARAQRAGELPDDASLVLLGGFPGEWEGEHPADAIAASGARNVFLGGWHDHGSLPSFLSAADVFVLASVREQFGSVLVEAHGLRAAGDRGRPLRPGRHRHRRRHRLAGRARRRGRAGRRDGRRIDDPVERRRRGRRAWRDAHERFSWPALAGDLAAMLDEVAADDDVAGARFSARTPTA